MDTGGLPKVLPDGPIPVRRVHHVKVNRKKFKASKASIKRRGPEQCNRSVNFDLHSKLENAEKIVFAVPQGKVKVLCQKSYCRQRLFVPVGRPLHLVHLLFFLLLEKALQTKGGHQRLSVNTDVPKTLTPKGYTKVSRPLLLLRGISACV